MSWLNDTFGFVKDVTQAGLQPAVSLWNVVTGDHSVAINYSTGIGKLAGQLQGDAVKTSAQPLSSSLDSVTGYKTDLQYETGAGAAVGGFESGLANGVHGGLKAFANGVTGGLATKLTNSVRDTQYREGDGTALFNLTGQQPNVAVPQLANNGVQSSSFFGSGSIIGLIVFLLFIFLSKKK